MFDEKNQAFTICAYACRAEASCQGWVRVVNQRGLGNAGSDLFCAGRLCR